MAQINRRGETGGGGRPTRCAALAGAAATGARILIAIVLILFLLVIFGIIVVA